MTKAENRAAARAYHQEQQRKRAEVAHAEAVAADLARLKELRRYLISGARARVPAEALIAAIDEHAEKLTGDRRALHEQNHSIG